MCRSTACYRIHKRPRYGFSEFAVDVCYIKELIYLICRRASCVLPKIYNGFRSCARGVRTKCCSAYHTLTACPKSRIVIVICCIYIREGICSGHLGRTNRTPEERENLRSRAGVVGREGRGRCAVGDALVNSPLYRLGIPRIRQNVGECTYYIRLKAVAAARLIIFRNGYKYLYAGSRGW